MTWILPRQLHTLACALDTAALSLDYTEQSEVCAQSLFVRSKPSPLRTWSAKWKRDSWTQHLSGRILRPSLGQRFVTEWTSSLGATHASPSVQPGNEKVSKTRGIFGRLLQMVFDFSDPSSASLKTSKDISRWGCPTSSKTWQEWVIERRGAYSARLNVERRTSASGCSSWPSPVASEVRQGFQDRSRGMKGSQESLTTVVVKSWPTPAARDHKDTGENVDMEKVAAKSKLAGVVAVHGPAVPASSSTDGSRPGLSQEGRLWMTPKSGACGMTATTSGRPLERATQLTTQVHVVEKQWQTATVSTGAHRQKDGSMIDKLDQQVKSWATPRAGKTTDENPETWKARQEKGDVSTMPLTAQVKNHTNGKLNPRWVETLMGLPVGWTMPSCASPVTIEQTSCDYSAMESFRRQQNEPFEY
jgi:hypothetical protein